MRQPPDRLVEVDVLQPQRDDSEDEDHRLEHEVPIRLHLSDVRVFRGQHQVRERVRVLVIPRAVRGGTQRDNGRVRLAKQEHARRQLRNKISFVALTWVCALLHKS